MKVSVMQPYLFPYIGYYQMIAASDIFVFYDNVDFIQRGWINRNRIISKEDSQYFTVPLKKVKQGQLINEVLMHDFLEWKENFIKTLRFTYQKAPYFEQTFTFIENFLSENDTEKISDLACHSVKSVLNLINCSTNILNSSELSVDFNEADKVQKIILILQELNANEIILPPGSTSLYSQDDFSKSHIKVSFMKLPGAEYRQFGNKPFKPYLSIIDVMMFNDIQNVSEMIKNHQMQ